MTDNLVTEIKPDWEFDSAVVSVFPDMLSRSIPQLEELRASIIRRAYYSSDVGTHVIDIGASLGANIAPLVQQYPDRTFDLYEPSEAMRDQLMSQPWFDSSAMNVISAPVDGATTFRHGASLALSVLTLQFIQVEHRAAIVHNIYNSLATGGAFILAEKICYADIEEQETAEKSYHEFKRSNGYSAEQIETKRRALNGVLVPRTEEQNEEMLKLAGFDHVTCFWAAECFRAWICTK